MKLRRHLKVQWKKRIFFWHSEMLLKKKRERVIQSRFCPWLALLHRFLFVVKTSFLLQAQTTEKQPKRGFASLKKLSPRLRKCLHTTALSHCRKIYWAKQVLLLWPVIWAFFLLPSSISVSALLIWNGLFLASLPLDWSRGIFIQIYDIINWK